MIGWIVEKMSRSGWRQKWRRFRIVTTAMSVTLDSASRSDGACGRHSRRGRPDRALGHGNGALRVSRSRSEAAGQLQEDVIERRPTQAHLADADPRATQLRGGLLDKDQALPRRRQRQPVRPPVLLRLAAADAKQCGLASSRCCTSANSTSRM